MQTLIMILMAAYLLIVFSLPGRPGEAPPEFFGFVVGFALVIQLVFALPSFIAAYGILRRKSWARVAAISAGLLSALNLPFGAAACFYACWFFLGESWKSVYDRSDPQIADGVAGFGPADVSRWSGYTVDERGEISFHHVDPPDWR